VKQTPNVIDMYRILVVDDEADICEILQFNLETEGYEVETAHSAEEALELLRGKDSATAFHLILLDVMMGDMSGFEMAKKLREDKKWKNIPIIFITALAEESDMVKGLNIGGDDYISKPLSIKNVIARTKAVLRRYNPEDESEDMESTETSVISYKTLIIDLERKMVSVDGKDVQLTHIEYELLKLLMENSPRVFSREQILDRVWRKDTIVLDRTVDVNITRLRKKIGEYGKCIKTKFGFGYTFEK